MSDGTWYAWTGRFDQVWWRMDTVTIAFVRPLPSEYRFDTEGR